MAFPLVRSTISRRMKRPPGPRWARFYGCWGFTAVPLMQRAKGEGGGGACLKDK